MRCSGPEDAKHRTSLGKSTDVLPQKYGCFHQRSPMFLYSRKEVPQFERFVKRAQRPNLWTMLSERNESKIANAVFHESFMEHRRRAETNPRTREGFLTAKKREAVRIIQA